MRRVGSESGLLGSLLSVANALNCVVELSIHISWKFFGRELSGWMAFLVGGWRGGGGNRGDGRWGENASLSVCMSVLVCALLIWTSVMTNKTFIKVMFNLKLLFINLWGYPTRSHTRGIAPWNELTVTAMCVCTMMPCE